jgi:hypothetical protein
MNERSGGWWRRRAARGWWSAVRQVPAVVPLTVAIIVAGLALVVAIGTVTGIVRAGQIVLLLLSPALLFGAASAAPRGVRAAQRLVDNRRAERQPQPGGPPIERIAADLRRMLWEHDQLTRSDKMAARARRLWALEAAIADCATQASRALGLDPPDRPAHGRLDRLQLRIMLRAIAAEGLVLPARVDLMAPDSRA